MEKSIKYKMIVTHYPHKWMDKGESTAFTFADLKTVLRYLAHYKLTLILFEADTGISETQFLEKDGKLVVDTSTADKGNVYDLLLEYAVYDQNNAPVPLTWEACEREYTQCDHNLSMRYEELYVLCMDNLPYSSEQFKCADDTETANKVYHSASVAMDHIWPTGLGCFSSTPEQIQIHFTTEDVIQNLNYEGTFVENPCEMVCLFTFNFVKKECRINYYLQKDLDGHRNDRSFRYEDYIIDGPVPLEEGFICLKNRLPKAMEKAFFKEVA